MQVLLTAWKVGPASEMLTTPRIFPVESGDIQYVKPKSNGPVNSVVKTKIGGRGAALELWVAENYDQVEVARDPSSTNPNSIDLELGMAALGSTQGNGVAAASYYNEITSATVTTAEAVDLPAATVGLTRVIVNATVVPLEIFPASGEQIQGLAVDLEYDLGAKRKVHFSCKTAGLWEVATNSNPA